MPAMIYGELLLALGAEFLVGRRAAPLATLAIVVPIGLVTLHFAPWVYGYPVPQSTHASLKWMPRWD